MGLLSTNYSLNLLAEDKYVKPSFDSSLKTPTDLKFNSSLKNTPLSVNEAYKLSIRQETPGVFALIWDIQDDYYLYKSKFAFSPQPTTIKPSSNFINYEDQFFGKQDIYYNYALILLEFGKDKTLSSIPDKIKVSYQGCWDKGLCYPLEEKLITINYQTKNKEPIFAIESIYADNNAINHGKKTVQETYSPIIAGSHNYYLARLKDSAAPWIILLFFLAGLGLTFTPCVLPMLPILSGIITGRNSISAYNTRVSTPSFRTHIFLALTYIGVMSLTFSSLGLLSGFFGYAMREALGSTSLLLIMSSLIVMLGLSMLNLYQFGIPTFLSNPVQKYLSLSIGKLSAFSKAAIWGFLSPLVVGTCLSAPLAAAMLYLAEKGNPWFGAVALMALSLGMGFPLLLFALGLGQLLPRTGRWMEGVRAIFALILFGLAVFILSALLPVIVEWLLYCFLISASLFLVLRMSKLNITIATLVASIFFLGLTFYTAANYKLLPYYADNSKEDSQFKVAQTYDEMIELIQKGKEQSKPQLIYYYADWCVSCREIEWLVFNNYEIQEELQTFNLIKADVTKSSSSTRQMLEYFQALGPPSIIFLNKQARMLPHLSLIGNFNKMAMKHSINQIIN